MIAGGATLGLVTVVGGVLAATTLGGGGSSSAVTATGSQRQEVGAVTTSPTQAWTWSGSEDSSLRVLADGDLVIVSDANSESVTRLAEDGAELWQGDGVFVQAVDQENDLVLVATVWEGNGFAALDAETGKELFSQPDHNAIGILDGDIIWSTGYDEDTQVTNGAAFSPEGELRWDSDGEYFIPQGDVVVRLDGTEITALDARTGSERWSITSPVSPDPDYALNMAVANEFVAVSFADEAAAFDLETGDVLWEIDGLTDFSGVESTGGGLVHLTRAGDSDAFEDGQVNFYDRTGEVGTIATDPDDYFYATAVRVDGANYFADANGGIVYDEALKPVGSFNGRLTPAGDGYYQIYRGELSYRELDGTETWSRQVSDPDDEPDITPLDGRLLVTVDDTVTGYE